MKSIRAKIFLSVMAILVAVAGTVMLSSRSAVRGAMVEAEERSVGNVLHMAELAIRGQYSQLLAQKVQAIQTHKTAFRQFGQVVNATLEQFQGLAATHVVTEGQAKAMALRWLADLRPVSGDYMFVFDRAGRALVYPEQGMKGEDLSGYRDFKGRSVTAAAWEESENYGDTFLTYQWKQIGQNQLAQKYGYFAPFRQWEWMIATVGDVAAIQAEVDGNVRELVAHLNGTLGAVRMAGDGFVFVFRDGGMIVPPKNAESARITPAMLDRLKEMAPRYGGLSRIESLTGDVPHALSGQVFYLKALGWYVAAVISSDALQAPAQRLVTRQAAIFAGALVLGALLAWVTAARVSRPLVRLAAQARALSRTDFSQPRQAVAGRTAVPGKDEVGRLAQAFAFMEEALHRNVRSLMTATSERERIESELNVARDIQLGLLPKVFPAFPGRRDIDIHAALISAKEVGGDLYDFYFVDDDLLCLTIGDVAGKGVPASLFMAVTKTLIKAAAEKSRGPARMMTNVNDALATDNPNAIFVTSFIGLVDCRTGALAFANGGHNPSLIVRTDGRVEVLRALSGPALGVLEEVDYVALAARLDPGDMLLLYTDGVTEAMDPQFRLYTEERLLVLAARHSGGSARVLVDAILADVRLHAAGAPQSDDVTVLAMRYWGPEGGFGR